MTTYCLHCLALVHETQPQCGHCAAPFQGCGQFDRVTGPAPSRDFAFLFTRTPEAVAGHGFERRSS
jgi:hypothetical protein